MTLEISSMDNILSWWLYIQLDQWLLLCPIILHLLRGNQTVSLFCKNWFLSPTHFYFTILITISLRTHFLICTGLGGRDFWFIYLFIGFLLFSGNNVTHSWHHRLLHHCLVLITLSSGIISLPFVWIWTWGVGGGG